MSADGRVLRIMSSVSDPGQALETAQELAWGHAVALAQMIGDEVGSEEFLEYYNRYLDRYTVCCNHSNFLFHTALRTFREIIDGPITLSAQTPDRQSMELISEVAHILTSAVMWTVACLPEGWIPNEQWNELPDDFKVVDFPLAGDRTERESNASDAE